LIVDELASRRTSIIVSVLAARERLAGAVVGADQQDRLRAPGGETIARA
jgi:hypothetical protein